VAKPLDHRVEGTFPRHAQIEENPRLLSLDLRTDQARRRPRCLLAQPSALENLYRNAVLRKMPRNRSANYAAADYESFHGSVTSIAAAAQALNTRQGAAAVASPCPVNRLR
jgi:hypothetical protein